MEARKRQTKMSIKDNVNTVINSSNFLHKSEDFFANIITNWQQKEANIYDHSWSLALCESP